MGLWQWGYPKAAIQMGQKSTEFGSITILKYFKDKPICFHGQV
jgi:hypothetical protein